MLTQIKNRIEKIKANRLIIKGSEFRIAELNNIYQVGLQELEKGFGNRNVDQYKELIKVMNEGNEEAIAQLEDIKADVVKSKKELEDFDESELNG